MLALPDGFRGADDLIVSDYAMFDLAALGYMEAGLFLTAVS